MIGIRADGNKEIGTGHIMRCLTIAGALGEFGKAPLFLCIDGCRAVGAAGFESVKLDGRYDDLSAEDISPQLAKHGITTLVVDSYYADAAYYSRLPKGINTVRIFDPWRPGHTLRPSC